MTDSVDIQLIEDIWPGYAYQHPFLEKLYQRGFNVQLLHVDLTLDTSTVDTPTETTAPATLVDGDELTASGSGWLIGIKDGELQELTFSAGSLGTWDRVLYAEGADITDGGTTTFFSAAGGLGIPIIPDGKRGVLLEGKMWYNEDPGTAGHSFQININDDVGGVIARNHMVDVPPQINMVMDGETLIHLKHAYKIGMHPTYVHQIWVVF